MPVLRSALKRRRFLRASLFAALAACSPQSGDARSTVRPPPDIKPPLVPEPEPAIVPVAMAPDWRGFGFANCSYLRPTEDFFRQDGGFDVVFHFHAGQMSDRDMRDSGMRGVFVSCGYGIGTDGYSKAFESPERFGTMLRQLSNTIARASTRTDAHVQRLALASWSAGFAAISRILSVPEWYERTDAVILLDSLHAQYIDKDAEKGLRRGPENVDVRGLRHFIRFARDARAGRKLMIITHSAIVPPDYASTAESTAALMREAEITLGPPQRESVPEVNLARAMTTSVLADVLDFHVRGYRGAGPQDHFNHLHLVGEALKTWLVPRWTRPK